MRNIFKKILLVVLCGVLMVLTLSAGFYLFRLMQRPARSALRMPLDTGITYSRRFLDTPRPVMVHTVEINLRTPGLEFFVTPPIDSGERHTRAELTTRLAERFDLKVAVNGSHFEPFWSEAPWDYYPRQGDPVNVMGVAVSEGKVYSDNRAEWPKFCFYERLIRVCGGNEFKQAPHAIAGSRFPVRWGNNNPNRQGPLPDEPLPRTVIGYNQEGTRAWLVVVDGRQKRYSEGLTLFEMGDLMREMGAYFALNLDGGGSTTLVAQIEGQYKVLNAPYHTHIPMRERPVANALGVRIRGK